MNLIKYRKCITLLGTILGCLAHFALHANELQPWTKANINWQAYQGSQITVLADAHTTFLALKPHLPLFEKLTGIKVGYLTLEQKEMRKRRARDLTTGGGVYDVVPIGVTFLGQASQNQWLTPLHPFIEDPALTDKTWYNLEGISANSLKLCTINDTLLSIPFDFSAPVLFYRKDLFKKYNIAVPDSYRDVIKMKQKMQQALDQDKQSGIYAFASRVRPGAGLNTWMVIPAIRAYGGEILDQNNYPQLDSHQAAQALTTYRNMVVGYGNPPHSQLLHFYDIRHMFRDGKLAAIFSATNFYNEINTPSKSVVWDKWDAVKLPRGPHGRETSPWAWGLAINSSSKNQNAAWLFIQWATSQPTAELLSIDGAPARKAVWNSQAFHDMQVPGFIDAVNWVFTHATPAKIQAGMPEFPAAANVFSNAFSQIFYGADVKSTLKQANLQVVEIMNQNK